MNISSSLKFTIIVVFILQYFFLWGFHCKDLDHLKKQEQEAREVNASIDTEADTIRWHPRIIQLH
jgi:nitrogen fixation-related uncharacterized protein